MARYDDLPYRTCVGITLINPEGLVFLGRRVGGPEHVDQTHIWQMPQGGVDSGEDTWTAAKRELYEETNAQSVEKLGEVSEWLTYDIPRTVAGRAAIQASTIHPGRSGSSRSWVARIRRKDSSRSSR